MKLVISIKRFYTINLMKNILFLSIRRYAAFALIVSSLALTVFGQTYIQNVTVVDVENRRLLSDQTVVIKDGIISEIAAAKKITPPANSNIINGAGNF